MKKIVLTFGLISGAVSSLMMLLTIPFIDRVGFDRAEVIGYATIIASFLLVFFGIRAYRERVGGGVLTFARGCAVGALITLVSSTCYVATWQVLYHRFAPGFADKYAAYAIDREKASGASQERIEEVTRQMQVFKQMYENPLTNIAITFLEPTPIGLVVALVSAAILRKRPGAGSARSESAHQPRL
jgi:hypothetical protein